MAMLFLYCSNLQGNPLVCDCKLKWLSDKLRSLGDRSNVTCESPFSVSGQLVSELSPDQFLCRKYANLLPTIS